MLGHTINSEHDEKVDVEEGDEPPEWLHFFEWVLASITFACIVMGNMNRVKLVI